jgi:hypothetical protein
MLHCYFLVVVVLFRFVSCCCLLCCVVLVLFGLVCVALCLLFCVVLFGFVVYCVRLCCIVSCLVPFFLELNIDILCLVSIFVLFHTSIFSSISVFVFSVLFGFVLLRYDTLCMLVSGRPPLVEAASILNDPDLDKALSSIALQEALPVLAVFFACTGASAQSWLALDVRVAEIAGSDVLSKLIVQKTDDGCAVVLHSTVEFATSNTGVHGSSSSAARVGDASSDASREDHIIAMVLAALRNVPNVPAVEHECCTYGPLLHRWGNAFPKGAPLPESMSVCPSSRVAFCGDYTETVARMGSVESALLSGTGVGAKIAQEEARLCSL